MLPSLLVGEGVAKVTLPPQVADEGVFMGEWRGSVCKSHLQLQGLALHCTEIILINCDP